MKFLIKDIGRDEFLHLVDEEKKALSHQMVEIDTTAFDGAIPEPLLVAPKVVIEDTASFRSLEKIKCDSAETNWICGDWNQSFIGRFLY